MHYKHTYTIIIKYNNSKINNDYNYDNDDDDDDDENRLLK
jgi:hypothetical protein